MEKALQIVDGVALEVQGLQADVLLEVLDRRDSLAVQVEDIVELGGVRVTVWIFARVGICEGQSRVHLREEEGGGRCRPNDQFLGDPRVGSSGSGRGPTRCYRGTPSGAPPLSSPTPPWWPSVGNRRVRGGTDALEPTMVDPPQKVSAQTSQRDAR